MPTIAFEFPGAAGVRLAARLDLPDVGPPRAYALFAHCFTCGKDAKAAATIGKALAAAGIGTLRFDFTGLGDSEGDFGVTTFTSNIDDLLAAARHLRASHGPARLVIGHSLGGSAALMAAARIADVRAVVTLGAPYRPSHVLKHLEADLARIQRDGIAAITLAGRSVRIGRAFVRDVIDYRPERTLKICSKPLLVLHSTGDRTVPLEEAGKIFAAARHPKSFVALPGVDHLLTERADGQYVGQLIASWSARYLHDPADASAPPVPSAPEVEQLVMP